MTVTADFDSTVTRMNRDEAKILAYYAAGESLEQMAVSTRLPRSEVQIAVEQLARGNRNLAQNLVQAWRKANPQQANGAPVAPLPPLVTRKDTIGDLLDRASLSGVPRLERLAAKAHELVDQLEEQVREHERGAQLRAEADQLEARLAEIRQQLGPKRSGAAAQPAGDGPDRKVVRAWAMANGVACPARGRVPASAVAAYLEAHGGAR